LAQGESFADEEERLESERENIRQGYLEKALSLSAKRRICAAQVCTDIEKALASLDMARARFTIRFDPEDLEQPMAARRPRQPVWIRLSSCFRPTPAKT